jgi:hypothetical protein
MLCHNWMLLTPTRSINHQVFTPSIYAGGNSIMINKPCKPRHPIRMTWPHEHLFCEHAIAIACAVEPSSATSYSSAVKSYFSFCSAHFFPIDPTPDMLSFYAVYTAHYIKPDSISPYLSGICNQLEPFFPEICSSRHHWLVKKTLAGCRKMLTSTTSRK